MDISIGVFLMMISKLFGLDPELEGMARIFALIFVMAFVISVASVL